VILTLDDARLLAKLWWEGSHSIDDRENGRLAVVATRLSEAEGVDLDVKVELLAAAGVLGDGGNEARRRCAHTSGFLEELLRAARQEGT